MELKPEQAQFIERMAVAPDLIARDLVHLFDGNFGIDWMDRSLKIVAEDRVRSSNLAGMLLLNCLAPAAVGLVGQDTRYAFSRMPLSQQAALDKALADAIAKVRMSHATELAMSVPLPGANFSVYRRRSILLLLMKWLEAVPDAGLVSVIAKREHGEVAALAKPCSMVPDRIRLAAQSLLQRDQD